MLLLVFEVRMLTHRGQGRLADRFTKKYIYYPRFFVSLPTVSTPASTLRLFPVSTLSYPVSTLSLSLSTVAAQLYLVYTLTQSRMRHMTGKCS
jgi:hypothetical protein